MLITNHNIFLNHAKSQNRVNHKSEIKNSSIYTHASQKIKNVNTLKQIHIYIHASQINVNTQVIHILHENHSLSISFHSVWASPQNICLATRNYNTILPLQCKVGQKMTNNYYYSHAKQK